MELNRGNLEPQGRLAAAAADEEELAFYVVNQDGLLFRAEADVLAGDPFDYLRLGDGVPLSGAGVIEDGALALAAEGRVWVASGGSLRAWTSDGALVETLALPGQATDLAWIDGGIWAATSGGLLTPGGDVLDVAGERVVGLDGVAWVTLPGSDEVLSIDGELQERYPVEGLLAAAAADEGSGKLYVATTSGIAVLEGGSESARYPVSVPMDLAVTVSHEVLSLGTDGDVEVFLDEEALVGPAPLDIVPITFFEKPRSPDEDLGCRDEEQSVQSNAARALANMPWIEDLPGRFAFAVTPHAALRVVECNELYTFRAAIDHDFLEHGVLFHREYGSCDEDQDCHRAELAAELSNLGGAGIDPLWSTGLTPHVDAGFDWVSGLVDAGFDRFLFFGMSVLPEIPHHGDPRSKESFPMDAETRAAAWRVSSAFDTWPGDPDGGLTLYPGDSVAAFTLSGCPNVFIQECRLVSGGGGQRLEPEDITVMQLQLHRSLAARRDGQVNAWSFHLPDLGAFDYVSGCTESGRIWSGDDCQAQVLQEWMLDLNQRYVLNGVARWATPSELETP